MRPIPRRLALLLIAPVAAAGLAACSGGGNKAGGEVKPVTLAIATDDSPNLAAAPEIREFARQVQRLSGGKMRIEPHWHAAGNGRNWDQRNARLVESGKLAMGLIPARSWDTEGVTSLRALNTPFLITSDALAAKVVSGPLAPRLMSGLPRAGVTGLALVPEELRHPFGFSHPVRGPADYRGQTIRIATSNTVAAMYAALGSKVTDANPNASKQAAVESGYVQDPDGIATGNVTFYPKVNALVVNSRALARLDRRQVTVLERAAAATRAWAISMQPSDLAAARAFCARGKKIVLASQADIAALERATQPVVAELRRDALTSSLIDAIGALKQHTPAPTGTPSCAGKPAPASGTTPAGERHAIDGVYRYVVTERALRHFGVTDQGVIDENVGVITYTLNGGRYCWTQKAPNPVRNPSECSTYEIAGNRMTLDFPSGPPDVYLWKKVGRGDLQLTLVRTTPEDVGVVRASIAEPWKRLGDSK
jgi:TRAP-type C4-dicarboxylate transport system substrate-binding protein